jgi:DNA-binding CsgD family transcriptional regulator
MSSSIQRLFESLPPAASIEDFGLVVHHIRTVYQLDHVVYFAVSLGQGVEVSIRDSQGELRCEAGEKVNAGTWRIENGLLATTTYQDNWISRYLEANFVRVDPVVAASLEAFHPIDWKSLDWTPRKTREFLREAISAGIGNQGYTIPVRGPNGQFACFTVNKSCSDEEWAEFTEKHKSDLLIISHYYHQKVLEIMNVSSNSKAVLSTREMEVLRGLSLGKNRARIAQELGVSENTIRVYIDSARYKLGALNTSHAIAVSISKGILSI